MNLVEVVILIGAQCMSPMESGPGLTEVGKVPCAVLIRQDPATADIEIVPQAAATDPDVIAMLVKPRGIVPLMKADRMQVADAGDVTGSVTPAPRIVPTSADVEPGDVDAPKTKRVAEKKVEKAQVSRKRSAVARRTDACGSYRAVWYTNKEGRRRYRCVKSG